jgi:hypothetical protein
MGFALSVREQGFSKIRSIPELTDLLDWFLDLFLLDGLFYHGGQHVFLSSHQCHAGFPEHGYDGLSLLVELAQHVAYQKQLTKALHEPQVFSGKFVLHVQATFFRCIETFGIYFPTHSSMTAYVPHIVPGGIDVGDMDKSLLHAAFF